MAIGMQWPTRFCWELSSDAKTRGAKDALPLARSSRRMPSQKLMAASRHDGGAHDLAWRHSPCSFGGAAAHSLARAVSAKVTSRIEWPLPNDSHDGSHERLNVQCCCRWRGA